MSHLQPTEEYHQTVLERFRASCPEGTPTYQLLERAREIEGQVPLFSQEQIRWLQALATVTKADMPITEGFSSEQITNYAQRIGAYNGLVDMVCYIEAAASGSPLTPAKEQHHEHSSS